MNAGQLAALIAAGSFAAGVCACVYVLAKLARLICAATAVLDEYRDSAEDLLRRAHAVADQADEQLARTGTLADSVEQVSASMSELSEQVRAVPRVARAPGVAPRTNRARVTAVSSGALALRLAAVGHGVGRAMAIRRAGQLSGLLGAERARQ